MNKRLIIVVVFLLTIVGSQLQAQERSNRIEEASSKGFTGLVRMGLYLEGGFHPGLKLGASYLLKEKEKSKKRIFRQKKLGNKTKNIQYLLDGNTGFYVHPNHHRGIMLGLGFTRSRMTVGKKGTLAWSFELLYLRRMNRFKTYQLTAEGTIEKVRGAGSNSFIYAISPTFGRTLGAKKGGKGLDLYFKPSLQVLKYNHSYLPTISFEIGSTLNLFKS